MGATTPMRDRLQVLKEPAGAPSNRLGEASWLRRALCEAAWAASKSKGTYLPAQFRRLAAWRGPKRALIAVASSILTAGYYMLHRGTTTKNSALTTLTNPTRFELHIAWLNASKLSGTESSSNPASFLLQAVRRIF